MLPIFVSSVALANLHRRISKTLKSWPCAVILSFALSKTSLISSLRLASHFLMSIFSVLRFSMASCAAQCLQPQAPISTNRMILEPGERKQGTGEGFSRSGLGMFTDQYHGNVGAVRLTLMVRWLHMLCVNLVLGGAPS